MTISVCKNRKDNNKPRVVAIVGPTASGKTEFAVNYALENNGEIVSADSRLVYKGFDITCAKPTIEERKGVPHFMMDIATPDVDYSAGMYAKEARSIIYYIISRGKLPIVVGGTGLYFRLLLENYNPPEFEPDYNYRDSLKNIPASELHIMLREYDEEVAALIDKNDKKKIIRALEIVKITGKSLAEARGKSENSEFSVDWIGLNYPRTELYERINKRVDVMLSNGMLDETKYLLNTYGRVHNLISTIGYQEMIMYIDGILSLEEALDKLKQNTRRYAKRQLTWFRRNENIKWNVYPEILPK